MFVEFYVMLFKHFINTTDVPYPSVHFEQLVNLKGGTHETLWVFTQKKDRDIGTLKFGICLEAENVKKMKKTHFLF